MESYGSVIKDYSRAVAKVLSRAKKSSDDSATLSRLLSAFYDILSAEILVVCENDEVGARKHLRYVISEILPIVESRVVQFSRSKKEDSKKLFEEYLVLYKKYLNLCAYRSYKHFCLACESVFDFRLWSDTKEVESGYFYYANQMVLGLGNVNFMERQLPTGYGKTIGNAFMCAFILGVNPNSDILYVCGNDKFTNDVISNVIKIMTSEEYANIFPFYQKFGGERDLMFSMCQLKDGKFAINGSKKSTNFRVVTKLSDVNGVRAEYLFLDDITQRSDMAIKVAHDRDIHAFLHEWFERNYSRSKFKIIASGTTYSDFDILSFLKVQFNYANAYAPTINGSVFNKYTMIANADFITPDGVSVFISIPLLDFDTDESTYPQKISTESARKKRDNSYVEFMAMDQQQPLPPDDNPFYFKNLREYEMIPTVGQNGRSEYCVASLDPKRSGNDYISMPIFIETNDGYYLKDWLYDKRPMKDLYDFIVGKIIQHKITELAVERNTDEGIAPFLLELLRKKGYTACKIVDIYNTEAKDKRIGSAEADIKAQLIFPKFGMYANNSMVGKALESLYTFTYGRQSTKNYHDDAPDSLAIFTRHFISKKFGKKATFVTFKR